jgi:DNA-binding Xre family transcriptional regulator
VTTRSAPRGVDHGIVGDVAHLYVLHESHVEICRALNLTRAQLRRILADLFAEGMPKRARRVMTEAQVREVHRSYQAGAGSIDELSEAIGFTGRTARRRMREMTLSLSQVPDMEPGSRMRSPARAEQRKITALVVARVDSLRAARGWSVERLAGASNVSMWTLFGLRRDVADPRLSTLLRLCSGLGVTSGELLGDLPLPVEPRTSRARTAPAPAGVAT